MNLFLDAASYLKTSVKYASLQLSTDGVDQGESETK